MQRSHSTLVCFVLLALLTGCGDGGAPSSSGGSETGPSGSSSGDPGTGGSTDPGFDPGFGGSGGGSTMPPGDAGVDCDVNPSECLPPGVCGDGEPGLGESCDDRNTQDGDGCSSSCQIEAPYYACSFGELCIDVRDCEELIDAGVEDVDCVAPPRPVVCGDGIRDPGEACDDGNVTGGDGCSVDCTSIEDGYACPTPGAACISTVICGDGRVTGGETCDDGNGVGLDGCSTTCELEEGWVCPAPGASCRAAACGDGLRVGTEACDDGNTEDGDGCSASCALQAVTETVDPTATQQPRTIIHHYDCVVPTPTPIPPRQVCFETVCGDGMREGTEQCDDANNAPLDGCSPNCELEPRCPSGACEARCGDGLLFDFDANGDGAEDEDCDDGNTDDGDGCSSACTVEAGYACVPQSLDFPEFIDVPVVMRDFKFRNNGDPESHPDFERYECPEITPGLVQANLVNGVPAFRWDGTGVDPTTGVDTNGSCGRQLTSALDLSDWYKDISITVGGAPRLRSRRIDDVMIRLSREGAPGNFSYVFDSRFDAPYDALDGFFPIDGRGFGNEGGYDNNFAFTTELRTWFTYDASQSPRLDFSGDDDVWVFVNNRRALDLGGLHPRKEGSFVLNPAKAAELGLVDGHVYEVALFHAERHTEASNFRLTLRGFLRRHSVCNSVCGDGVRTPEEQCDEGGANVDPATTSPVPYDSCTTSCTRGPFCGDGVTTSPPEICDDGLNLSPWVSDPSEAVCAPGCVAPAYCGDGVIQSIFGERCDDGAANTDAADAYAACRTDCVPGPRCGDALVQASFGEQCDNGFNVTPYIAHPGPDDCGPGCQRPTYCGNGTVELPYEQCDEGAANTDAGTYDACTTSCRFGPRCGDGVLQPMQEECDDGNRVNDDGCSAACTDEVVVPN